MRIDSSLVSVEVGGLTRLSATVSTWPVLGQSGFELSVKPSCWTFAVVAVFLTERSAPRNKYKVR